MNAPLSDRFRALPSATRELILAEVEREFGAGALADLRYDFEGFWLRATQIVTDEELAPKDRDPPALVVFTGPRGDGKTQSAVTLFDRLVRTGEAKRPRIFAATEGDVDKAVVHGESGIMSLYRPSDPNRPRFMRQEGPAGVLRYPNGTEVLCYSAKVSEGAVSYNADLDLYDDVAKWGAYAYTAWAHARLSCRIGMALGIVATTRRGTHLLRRLLGGNIDGVLMKRGDHLDANRFNLSPKLYRQIRAELGESDLLRQELDDEDTSSTSPFVDLDFDSAPIRILEAPRSDFSEVVVAVDPAEGKGGDHDEWGVGAAGRRHDRHVVALDDASGSYDDAEAADAAIRLCEVWDAKRIVVESNRGKRVMNAIEAAYYRRKIEAMQAGEAIRPMPELVPIQAKDGKVLRAGPLRVLYLGGTLHHVPGLKLLEKQQREWDPSGPKRPRQDDRIDWWVHAVHYLADLGGLGGMKIEHVEGLGDRNRQLVNKSRDRQDGRDLMRSDTVPASDPRSSFRPRGQYSLRKRKIF